MRDLIYWKKGFSFDRNRHGNRVAIETYRLLTHYTSENRNCRFGAYLIRTHFSEFYEFRKIIPSFDGFIKLATTDDKLIESNKPQFFKELDGTSFIEDIELVLKLKVPTKFEYSSKNFFGEVFGYRFQSVLGIEVDPEKIISVEGESLDSFRIKLDSKIIDVRFRNMITIR